jgi:hypothetical protein
METTKLSLLDKLQAKSKGYVETTETVDVVITSILPTSKEDRVQIVTEKHGNLFAFKNTFSNGVPAIELGKKLSAKITLVEKGEFVNIRSVQYSQEDLGKYGFIATQRLVVQL